MKNKLEKKLKIRLIGVIIGIIVISFTSLVGCDSRGLVKEQSENKDIIAENTSGNKEITDEKTSENVNEIENKEPSEKEVASSGKSKNYSDKKEIVTTTIKKQTDSVNNKSVNEAKDSNGKNNFIEYISLLGLSKEKLISTLKENPNSIGEGGVEFKKSGIRVWFDKKNNTQVDQVFTMEKDIDLNGVKIGDKISRFKEIFGNPVSDKNGDAHFKYNGIFLSVNYDTKTGETYGVYILKHDF